MMRKFLPYPVALAALALMATQVSAESPQAAPVSPETTWAQTGENDRYLLIMGTMDGLSISQGSSAPCFQGKNNADIAALLSEAGFDDKPVTGLAEKLKEVSDKCAGSAMRGYPVELLKSMSDSNLATYLTGVTRGLSGYEKCKSADQGAIAISIAASILSADDKSSPNEALRAGVEEGCKSLPQG